MSPVAIVALGAWGVIGFWISLWVMERIAAVVDRRRRRR